MGIEYMYYEYIQEIKYHPCFCYIQHTDNLFILKQRVTDRPIKVKSSWTTSVLI